MGLAVVVSASSIVTVVVATLFSALVAGVVVSRKAGQQTDSAVCISGQLASVASTTPAICFTDPQVKPWLRALSRSRICFPSQKAHLSVILITVGAEVSASTFKTSTGACVGLAEGCAVVGLTDGEVTGDIDGAGVVGSLVVGLSDDGSRVGDEDDGASVGLAVVGSLVVGLADDGSRVGDEDDGASVGLAVVGSLVVGLADDGS